MSFRKAEQLLTLATLVASRHAGATLEEVVERFEVSKRTGQRMLRALEAQFPDTAVTMDDEGHKRWHLSSGALRDLMTLYPEELAALDLAMESLKRLGLTVEAEHLLKLRDPRTGATLQGRAPGDGPRSLTRSAGPCRTPRPTSAHRSQNKRSYRRGHQGLPHSRDRLSIAWRGSPQQKTRCPLWSSDRVAPVSGRTSARRFSGSDAALPRGKN